MFGSPGKRLTAVVNRVQVEMQDHPVTMVNQAHLALTDNQVHPDRMRNRRIRSCQLLTNVLARHLPDPEDLKVPMDLLEKMGNQEDQDLTVNLVLQVHLDQVVLMGQTANLDQKDLLETTENSRQVKQDQKVPLDHQDPQDLLALPANPETTASLVDQELPEHLETKEAQDHRADPAKMADLEDPEMQDPLVRVRNALRLVWLLAINCIFDLSPLLPRGQLTFI